MDKRLKAIVEAFDTPTQVEISELRKQKELLLRSVAKIDRRINQLIPKADKEGDQVANVLDRRIPGWRRVITEAIKNKRY